jgi:hypothetical protein
MKTKTLIPLIIAGLLCGWATQTVRAQDMSKLFRNVPCLTHERMSPLLVVVGCSPSPAGGAGRREAGA